MRYEKIILARIIYFLRQYLYGWLLVFPGESMRTGGGDTSSTACGSRTGASASGTAIRPSA